MTSPAVESFLRAGADVLLLVGAGLALLALWRAFRGSALHRLLGNGLLVAAIVLTVLPSLAVPTTADLAAAPSPSVAAPDVDQLALLVLPIAAWVWAYRLLPGSIAAGWWPQRVAIARVAHAGARVRRRQHRHSGDTFVAVLQLTGNSRGGYLPYTTLWSDSPWPDWASRIYVGPGRARLRPGMVCIAEVNQQLPYEGCRSMAGRPVAVLEPRTWWLGRSGFHP